MKFNHKQTAEATGFKVQVSHQLFNIFCLNNDTDTIWRHTELFYTTVQRNTGGKKKEENPKKLIPFWKEIFIKYKKGTPKPVLLSEVLKYPHGRMFYCRTQYFSHHSAHTHQQMPVYCHTFDL